MQVLDRIRYLLTSAAAPAALQPLLSLLGELALGGADVAHAICDMPGLVSFKFVTSLVKRLPLVIALLCPRCGRHCHARKTADRRVCKWSPRTLSNPVTLPACDTSGSCVNLHIYLTCTDGGLEEGLGPAVALAAPQWHSSEQVCRW